MRIPLLATAALSVLALAASPALATTIGFNALSGSNGTPFTSHTEGGYTVVATAGTVIVATSYGNPRRTSPSTSTTIPPAVAL